MGTKQKAARGQLFALPPLDFYSRPELHILCGGGVEINGCRSIAALSEGMLRVEAGHWSIALYGENLRVESLSGQRLLLLGELTRAEFERLPRGGEKA